ncbi:MarR family transcriptional regulator [Candidatus Woesebacteria bacterium]|nr:MarR family transcriptional regulator [Candidatus Woesebacteria bacterium]
MQDTTLQLVETIFHISRIMKDELSFENEVMRLSALQFHALLFLNQEKEGATMTAIADRFRIELPSATSLIATMSDHHLIQRRASETDRRLVVIEITDAGKALLNQAIDMRRKKLENSLSLFSDTEKVDLLTLLKTLQNRLQNHYEKK